MTDAELDVINYAIKFDGLLTTEGHITASTAKRVRKVILELIADLKQTRDELRQAKAERDWLVQTLEDEQYCYPAPRMEGGRLICEEQVIECDKCDRYSKEHWLKAAKEAACPRS